MVMNADEMRKLLREELKGWVVPLQQKVDSIQNNVAELRNRMDGLETRFDAGRSTIRSHSAEPLRKRGTAAARGLSVPVDDNAQFIHDLVEVNGIPSTCARDNIKGELLKLVGAVAGLDASSVDFIIRQKYGDRGLIKFANTDANHLFLRWFRQNKPTYTTLAGQPSPLYVGFKATPSRARSEFLLRAARNWLRDTAFEVEMERRCLTIYMRAQAIVMVVDGRLHATKAWERSGKSFDELTAAVIQQERRRF